MLPLVVTVESPSGQTRRYAFADSPVRVGRSPFAELQLTEAFVSRWEGTLRFDETEVTYFHVSSTNPTYIDGRVAGVHEEVLIGTTTVLTLGELKLRFAREVVRDEDLRRKGKRNPIKSDDGTVAKTVWLDAGRPLGPQTPAEPQPLATPSHPEPAPQSFSAYPAQRSEPPRAPPSQRPEPGPSVRPEAPALRPTPSTAPSAPARHDSSRPGGGSVQIAREVRVLQHKAIITPAHGSSRSEPPRPSGRPGVSEQVQSLARPAGGFGAPSEHPPASVGQPNAFAEQWPGASERPVDSVSFGGAAASEGHRGSESRPAAGANDLEGLHREYRASWDQLLRAFARGLERTPDNQRAAFADQFQRNYPQVTQEPDFRALLKQHRLEARKPEIPEISEWLRTIAQGVLPSNFRLDTGLTLERVLSLLEMLTQSFAEINDAQDNIRRHWLGRPPRASVLRSDNGRVILAYMLNPKADWNDRLGELEGAISDVVMHELSLFKATLEGARSLVQSMSPEAMAKAEEINLESLEESGSSSFLGRLLPRDSPEGRLWRRFTGMYEGLMDGDRYQRLFLGRTFARTYLAAMGQRDASEDKEKEKEKEKEK